MSMNEAQIKEFKEKIVQQLTEARKQKIFWIKKEIILGGSLAACEHIIKGQDDEKKIKPNKSPKETKK